MAPHLKKNNKCILIQSKKCFYGWPFYNLIDHKSILSVFDISYGHGNSI